MDDLPDDELIQAARERVRRAAKAAADAEARLERCERVAGAAARRLRELRVWWAARQGANSNRR